MKKLRTVKNLNRLSKISDTLRHSLNLFAFLQMGDILLFAEIATLLFISTLNFKMQVLDKGMSSYGLQLVHLKHLKMLMLLRVIMEQSKFSKTSLNIKHSKQTSKMKESLEEDFLV